MLFYFSVRIFINIEGCRNSIKKYKSMFLKIMKFMEQKTVLVNLIEIVSQ